MTDFHDWDDPRADLDDGESDALAAERARTEAWVNAADKAGAVRAAAHEHRPLRRGGDRLHEPAMALERDRDRLGVGQVEHRVQ
jgi:hypothetical protein